MFCNRRKSDGQYSKYVFSEFIKPIFDAAAIDYDLYEPRREGQVKEKIIELIQTGKEELEGKAKKKIEEANKKKTLLEKMFGSWERKLTPQEQHMLSFMERPKYCVDQSLIAVGAEGWTELLEGLDTGLRTNKPRKSEVVVGEGSEPNIENSEQKEAAMTIESEITQPNVEIPYGFELPALGFIPARQLNGWSLFPYRVYRWFLERKVLQVVGEEALRISFNEEKKKFVKEDFFFGSGTGLHGTTDIKTDNYENKLNLETMEKLQLIV
ncbi:hypothetical protein HK099_004084 [Clydaea vesicula]|uniref:Mitochondrial import inner membrane translocase subunit TIM54 n=1 Tax=Clydaea vesicula TaxID=447962 RepID=A0AAD5U871_9FUNG|nr:hypothetical protein HK099_004084 [Clydaea vesicula]